jgi:hypothetical protein
MMILPPFRRDREWVEISPEEGRRRWRFDFSKDVGVKVPWRVKGDFSFVDGSGREWGSLELGFLTVRKGYRWNGCSPKRWVPLLGWVGTPDTDRNLLGSGVHDLLYQASGGEGFPFSREEVDGLFLEILRASRFGMARTFHAAVKQFGGTSWGRDENGLRTVRLR